MTDYQYLIGADDAKQAAATMSEAADAFGRHVSYLDDVLARHERALEAFAARLETANKEPT